MAAAPTHAYYHRLRRLDGDSDALNIGLGIAIGVIVLLVAGFWLYQRHKNKRRLEERHARRAANQRGNVRHRDEEADQRTINFNGRQPAAVANQPAPKLRQPPHHQPYGDNYVLEDDEYRHANNKKAAAKQALFQMDQEMLDAKLDFNAIQYTRKLTKGAFGEVWLGQYRGKYVAIKQILEERKNDTKEIECFVAEIKLMLNLKHPNILDFLGFSWNPKDHNLCFLTEYMKNGDLFYYLQKRKTVLTWKREKIQLALDIAQGLVYLHSLTPKIIHRDLKSKNVLLDEKFTAKINDFGISRVRQFEETMTAGVGTALWAAPEVFMAKKYNDRADVYSLGVVLSELDTCAIPFADQAIGKNGKLDGMAVIKLVTQKRAKPTFSESCPAPVLELAMLCLDYEPGNRPSAADVVQLIQSQIKPALEAY
ncbi:TKL protein kinase [Aphanomyces astaci]|uniref:TKL protein kinase n=1 Tax=Aphanomyces astaci TaxID=112090 RepID=W4FEV7_APHAT|nr:TKL protein kinase [Aphanomyces astaci]ETV66000.1 TKL protein kinase [Aphanomyces astaci]|eukprot:XP_009844519.1 TKL protein kinase [Aphanomyces astaci]